MLRIDIKANDGVHLQQWLLYMLVMVKSYSMVFIYDKTFYQHFYRSQYPSYIQ